MGVQYNQYNHPQTPAEKSVLLFEREYGHASPHFIGDYVKNNLKYTLYATKRRLAYIYDTLNVSLLCYIPKGGDRLKI